MLNMSLIDYTNKIKNIDKVFLKKKDSIEYINLQISKDVKLARVQKGLTQKELADRVGTKQTSISRLESGRLSPSISFLSQIATALDTELISPTFASTQKSKKNTSKNYHKRNLLLATKLRDKGKKN